MLELWHEWNSVHSFKVRVALAEKGLEWVDRRLELLKFEHLTPKYLQLNPNGVVPTLVHDGQPILESTVICQYLDEAFAEVPLFPVDARERARCRAWLKYFDDKVHPAIRKVSFELLYRPLLARMDRSKLAQRVRSHPDPARAAAFLKVAQAGPDATAVNEGTAAFQVIVRDVVIGLRGKGWLSGADFGMGDVAMAAFVERLDVLGMNHLWQNPEGREWALRIIQRPSVVNSRAPATHRLVPQH